ncbi:MAG: phosphotransferase [Deltaproteobacteria bacterium]|nr:MAG: phosphotransferase [Deltaproteobacteria bacterium]
MHGRTNLRLSSTESFGFLKRILAEHYDLGELVSTIRNELGYINVSYDIEMLKHDRRKQYLLRLYRTGTHENKIRFEHALMEELLLRGFHLSPKVLTTRYGTTHAKVVEQVTDESPASIVAIFDYLPGEDKYTWDAPLWTSEELTNGARVLALYHNTIYGWKGTSDWSEPRIIDRVPVIEKQWKSYVQTARDSVFDRYFLKQSNYLSGILQKSMFLPTREVYDTLPHLAIHGDFHPGNLKFLDGDVVGLFDFDWAKLDARCFDVGLAITYFCATWAPSSDGNVLLDRVKSFLVSYQKTARDLGVLGPLSNLELQNLPQMILMSNIYVLDWTIAEFYATNPDADEYLRYLKHGVRLMNWLEHNWSTLTSIALRYL